MRVIHHFQTSNMNLKKNDELMVGTGSCLLAHGVMLVDYRLFLLQQQGFYESWFINSSICQPVEQFENRWRGKCNQDNCQPLRIMFGNQPSALRMMDPPVAEGGCVGNPRVMIGRKNDPHLLVTLWWWVKQGDDLKVMLFLRIFLPRRIENAYSREDKLWLLMVDNDL